jgi:hypothetical protein
MNNFKDAALYYASIGWAVFPIKPGQKMPLTQHGCKDATTLCSRIIEWWTLWPDANIGLACGDPSGVVAIDIDNHGGKSNGFESLKTLTPLPSTIEQITPTGGAHYIYQNPRELKNQNGFLPGVDIHGTGYYILLAPSIHPNGGTYAWKDNCSPWERQAVAYPDFMHPKPTRCSDSGVGDTQQSGITIPQKSHPTSNGEPSIIQRASAYLESCDPAIQGQSGHSKLLWASVALVRGFLLSDREAYSLLAGVFNPRCIPPWDLAGNKTDEKDFRRKISEAHKVQPQFPDGWLRDAESYVNVESAPYIDYRDLVKDKTPKVKLKRVDIDIEREFLLRPSGLLGEMCTWLNATSVRPQPVLALASSLTACGALFGRKIKDRHGTRTNIYCMGIAPSSAGKNHAITQIRKLAAATGFSRYIGGADIASDISIEERMFREPVTLYLWDEIGHLLSTIKSHVNKNYAQVISLLMQYYSSSASIYLGREYSDQKKQRILSQPCCCIYGVSTPTRFLGGISPEELEDGWLSRCLVFSADYHSGKIREEVDRDTIPESLASKFKCWVEWRSPAYRQSDITMFVGPDGKPYPFSQYCVPTEKEAERIFIDFDNQAEVYGDKHQSLITLWRKAEENARRIALICAGSESYDNPVITEQCADYATRLIRYILLSFERIIAPEIVECQIDFQKRRIVHIIEDSGISGCVRRDITRRSQSMKKSDRDGCVSDLVESEEIIGQLVKESNKTYMRYWTSENYEQYAKHASNTD